MNRDCSLIIRASKIERGHCIYNFHADIDMKTVDAYLYNFLIFL